jgi:hypothetical protein
MQDTRVPVGIVPTIEVTTAAGAWAAQKIS